MILGIDLGTTNSLAAVWQDGEARIVPNALGDRLTPSVVGLDDTGEVLVGAPARERLLTHPEMTAAAFKRHMGTDHKVPLGKRLFRPEELSSFVLRSLKADAEAWLGQEIAEAVVTVPAYFNDTQRKATQIAGRLAGLKVERLLNEPTAAALAYGLHAHQPESSFIVLDLGGGTFDVSILELFEGVMEVRASGGDNFLGGEDFVDRLVAGFMDRVGREAGIERGNLQGKLLQALRNQAERAKRDITRHNSAEMRLRWGDDELSWTVDEDTLAELSKPLLDRLAAPIERTLRDARLRAAELDEVVLAGGATRMPLVRRLVARMFGRLPLAGLNPDEVVALGAAVQAGLKARDQALDDVVMTDVCPYTLGIAVSQSISATQKIHGLFLPVIERNTTIPASRVERVGTSGDHQSVVAVEVYQGESREVANNIRLGSLDVPVPPRPAGEVMIDVRFTYDVNGILEVETSLVDGGATRRAVLERNPGLMTPEEIDERLKALASLKIHPRENSENRTVLARAERMYQEHLGEKRTFIADHVTMFEAALDRQDPEEIAKARERLAKLLDMFEDNPFL